MDVPARSLIPSTASRKSEGVGPLGPAVCQTASVRELPGKELVTDAKLNYHGSITIDADFCRAVASRPLEYVEIWNKMSGPKVSTSSPMGTRIQVLHSQWGCRVHVPARR
ncbi:aspartate 1-decarboxylase [Sinorhizobium psoraleae]|uniref:aspartate 1-decarboxylase n=1 Tax=Sinorhizobium psoraleae TaxID=520838 RepID=UPI0035E3E689